MLSGSSPIYVNRDAVRELFGKGTNFGDMVRTADSMLDALDQRNELLRECVTLAPVGSDLHRRIKLMLNMP